MIDNLFIQETLDKLKKAYYANLARNMYLFSELRRILEAFNNKKVDTMVLKGAALEPMAELRKLTASLLTPTIKSEIARIKRTTTRIR